MIKFAFKVYFRSVLMSRPVGVRLIFIFFNNVLNARAFLQNISRSGREGQKINFAALRGSIPPHFTPLSLPIITEYATVNTASVIHVILTTHLLMCIVLVLQIRIMDGRLTAKLSIHTDRARSFLKNDNNFVQVILKWFPNVYIPLFMFFLYLG